MAGLAALAACSVIAWGEAIFVGAVYRPEALMLPTFGIRVQLTAVLLAPETAAENCCVRPLVSETVEGVTATETETEAGVRVSATLADALGFATLVANKVMLVFAVTLDGAVYRPLDVKLPVLAGMVLQVTAVFHEPETTAVNCWLSEAPSVDAAGVTATDTDGRRLMVAVAVVPLAAFVVSITVCAV